jgi:hypothetical protein
VFVPLRRIGEGRRERDVSLCDNDDDGIIDGDKSPVDFNDLNRSGGGDTVVINDGDGEITERFGGGEPWVGMEGGGGGGGDVVVVGKNRSGMMSFAIKYV